MGFAAGDGLTTGATTLTLATSGVAGESGIIRIGGLQTATYIAGIAGQTVGAGADLYVDNEGKLGVFLSACRFKTDMPTWTMPVRRSWPCAQ